MVEPNSGAKPSTEPKLIMAPLPLRIRDCDIAWDNRTTAVIFKVRSFSISLRSWVKSFRSVQSQHYLPKFQYQHRFWVHLQFLRMSWSFDKSAWMNSTCTPYFSWRSLKFYLNGWCLVLPRLVIATLSKSICINRTNSWRSPCNKYFWLNWHVMSPRFNF